MQFVFLTRPDDTRVAINCEEVLTFAPVPQAGPYAGPLTTGTRIFFKNATHQDVKELLDEVAMKLVDEVVPKLSVG